MKEAMHEIDVTKDYEQKVQDMAKAEPDKTKNILKQVEERKQKEREKIRRKFSFEEQVTEEFKKNTDRELERELKLLKDRTNAKLREQAKYEKENEIVQQKEIRAVTQKMRELDKEQQRQFNKKKELISHKIKEQARLEQEMADFHHEQKLKKFDSFRKDTLAHILAVEKEKQEGETALFRTKMDGMKNFFSGNEGKKRLTTLFGFTAATIGVMYSFRVAAPIAFHWMRQKMFAPKLVSRAVRQHPWTKFMKKQEVDIVIPENVKSKMQGIISATRNTASRGGIFGHLMLHGSPGTGKTLFAEKLAQDANMDFLMLSGPSFDQFEPKDAIVEINNLFEWVKKSKRGALVFIDEADSFLEDRDTLSPSRVRVLNEFIYHTGTESRDFMVVFETNRPWVIDPAVLSRISRSIEFPDPLAEDIAKMLDNKISAVLDRKLSLWQKIFSSGSSIDYSILKDSNCINELAKKFSKERFVGRDITNFVILLAQAAYACDMKITPALLNEIVEEQIQKKRRELALLGDYSELTGEKLPKEPEYNTTNNMAFS